MQQQFLPKITQFLLVQMMDAKTPADPNDTNLSVTKPKDSGNTKPNLTSSHNFVSLELFSTFYDDYIEYKHYVNDVI